jgi:hypothetical protein
MQITFGDNLSPSATYPAIIQTDYEGKDALIDAYQRGWNHGHGLACHNKPTIGETYWIDGEGKIKVDAENIRDAHQSLCYAAEIHSRCYSPFEFTAHEFNEAGEGDDEDVSSDELWEAFENGASDAITADLATYDDDDYGIEDELEDDDE